MQFRSAGTEQELFLSGSSAEEIKAAREREWAAVRESERRAALDPEKPIDRRPLFEQLQEQRDKKQEALDERFKLKNQIYLGLDQDEYEHVRTLERNKTESALNQWKEETSALQQFRQSLLAEKEAKSVVDISTLVPPLPPKPIAADLKVPGKSGKTQAQLLAGLVKGGKKRTADQVAPAETPSTDECKKVKTGDDEPKNTEGQKIVSLLGDYGSGSESDD